MNYFLWTIGCQMNDADSQRVASELEKLGYRYVDQAEQADIVVLNMKSTPIIEYRMQFAEDIHEALFIQMTLGDDRAVHETYVAGELRYSKDQ